MVKVIIIVIVIISVKINNKKGTIGAFRVCPCHMLSMVGSTVLDFLAGNIIEHTLDYMPS